MCKRLVFDNALLFISGIYALDWEVFDLVARRLYQVVLFTHVYIFKLLWFVSSTAHIIADGCSHNQNVTAPAGAMPMLVALLSSHDPVVQKLCIS